MVVDEGQDFETDWWLALEMLNKSGEDGPFYIFFDPAQNLFIDQDISIPDVGTPFDLPTNCRNSKQIALTCGKIRSIEIPVRPDAPEGVVTEIETIPQAAKRAENIRRVIEAWIGKGKLKTSQIAILSPFSLSKSCLADSTKVGTIPICTNPNEWRAGTEVVRLQSQLLNLRLLEEIDSSTYAVKAQELRDEEAELRLQMERCSRDRTEIIDVAVKAFELSQSLREKWVTADYVAKRRILEITCLNCTLDDVTLCVTMKKPFDLLAKELISKESGARLTLFGIKERLYPIRK